MALGHQAARGVDRQFAAQRGRARGDVRTALAERAETQHLGLIDFGKRGRVVDLGHVDIARPEVGARVGAPPGDLAQSRFVEAAVLAAGEPAAGDAHRACLRRWRQRAQHFFAAQEGGGCAVADRRAHRARQREAHRVVAHHLVDRLREAVLRLRVLRAEVVRLGRRDRYLLLRGAVFLHVVRRLHRVGIHEDRLAASCIERLAHLGSRGLVIRLPFLRVELVDRPGQKAKGLLRVAGVKRFFDADRQADFMFARQDVLPRALQGQRRRCAATLDIGHRHPLGEQAFTHQWREADLAANAVLAPGIEAAVRKPGGFDTRAAFEPAVGQHVGVDLARQVLEAAVRQLAESGARGADDENVTHDRRVEKKNWPINHLLGIDKRLPRDLANGRMGRPNPLPSSQH